MNFVSHTSPSSVGSVAASMLKGIGLLAGLALANGAMAIGTEAGKPIENQATATYTDAAGNPFDSTSNTATIVVAEVYAATIESDNDLNGAPGQTVYFPHTLTNNGNGTDTFTLTLSQDNTDEAAAAVGGQCQSFQLFEDANGNGTADGGETVLAVGPGSADITLDRDTDIDLVVSCQVPASAAPGAVIGVTLVAEAQRDGAITPDGDATNDDPLGGLGGASVDDITVTPVANGDDTLDGTNEDTVTVTDAAVLNVSKEATYNDGGTPNDLSDDTVTYEIVIGNTGIGTAYNVEISDTLAAEYAGSVTAVTDITIDSVSGNFADDTANPAEGASADWTAGTLVEVAANAGAAAPNGVAGAAPIATNDANGDGTAGDFGVRGHDDVLRPGATISVIFSVPVDATLAAATVIDNVVTVVGDNNDDGDAADAGETVTADADVVVPQTFAVSADDTGDALGGNGVNDGGDDDATVDDTQTVDTAPAGATVLFNNIITNNGSGEDTFELTIPAPGAAGNTFPLGTVFTIYDGTNTTQLSDTNSFGTIDTGPLDAGEALNITVRADLPDNASGDNGGAGYQAVITATSAGADAAGITPAVADTKTESLLNIDPPAVDLTNDAADGDPAVDGDNYIQGVNTPVNTESATPGNTVDFTLVISNDAGNSDSFVLTAGGSFDDDPTGVLGALPTGWSVAFLDATGAPVTTTGIIPAGGSETYTARVTISSDPNQALADLMLATALDIDDLDGDSDQTTGIAAGDLIDQNGDGDNDYAIFFMAKSVNTGTFDIKLDAVDVDDLEAVTLTDNNEGQIQPGGSIDYPHILTNEGNTVETIVLSTADDTAGFASGLVVDTDQDGVPDTLANPTVTSITVIDPDGNLVARTVTVDADGNITVDLNPGEQVAFNNRVFAPGDATPGTKNNTTVSADYNAGADTLTNNDQTEVVLGQLRLRKFAAADPDCDGYTPGTDDAWAITATTDVEPAQCGCWLVVGINDGTAAVENVLLNDAAPSFTQLNAGSSVTCAGNAGPEVGGTACTLADPGPYAATEAAPNISWDVGTLAPGAHASVSFCVTVD